MKWIKRAAISIGVLLAILITLPFFISVDRYIPQIEKEASERLKDPVTIKQIRLLLLPTPHAIVKGITVGKTEDVKLESISLTPDLWSLLKPTKVIRSIEIDGLALTQKGMEKLPIWFKSDGSREPPAVKIGNLRLDNAVLRFDKTSFGPFDAQVELTEAGDPKNALIKTQDGKLTAAIKPDKNGFLIDANAKGWKLPAGPAIVFDELKVTGSATPTAAEFNEVRARLYGGSVSGRVNVNWQKNLQLRGNLSVNQLELKPLIPLLAPGNQMSGKLNAKPVFSASAANAGQLMNALRLETPFDVQNGVLYGVDISKAATALLKQGTTGGETRFDQLSGHFVMERGAHRFTQLKIASGSLSADGNVSISAGKELSGRINAKVGSGIASASIPLDVTGTVASPTLLPTKAAIAGAAAGTLLLPGVGTGLGMKAGQALEGLFGRRDQKK